MSSSRGVIWERPERAGRGPAPSLSRDEITAAAVTLADTQGIEAVSMRALAVELGVGAASLYRYVARKDELIDLMVDAVMGNDLQFEICGEWRADLRSVARGLRAMTLRHPWMAVHGAGRRNLGPNTARRYEQVLGAIDGLGLEIDEMLVMIETLDAFVRGRATRGPLRAGGRPSLRPQPGGMDANPDPLRAEPDRQRPLPAPHPRRPRRPRPPRSQPPRARLQLGPRASARWPRHDAPQVTRQRHPAKRGSQARARSGELILPRCGPARYRPEV